MHFLLGFAPPQLAVVWVWILPLMEWFLLRSVKSVVDIPNWLLHFTTPFSFFFSIGSTDIESCFEYILVVHADVRFAEVTDSLRSGYRQVGDSIFPRIHHCSINKCQKASSKHQFIRNNTCSNDQSPSKWRSGHPNRQRPTRRAIHCLPHENAFSRTQKRDSKAQTRPSF